MLPQTSVLSPASNTLHPRGSDLWPLAQYMWSYYIKILWSSQTFDTLAQCLETFWNPFFSDEWNPIVSYWRQFLSLPSCSPPPFPLVSRRSLSVSPLIRPVCSTVIKKISLRPCSTRTIKSGPQPKPLSLYLSFFFTCRRSKLKLSLASRI